MTHPLMFPFSEYWWIYACFLVFVAIVLILDLGVFHKNAHTVSMKEAGTWTVVWIILSMIFNYGLYQFSLFHFEKFPELIPAGFTAQSISERLGLEFLTGYVIEKSLSVDNLFVFVVIFSYFKIPPKYQHKVLFYGILGALVFRAIFIGVGAALIKYEVIVFVLGAFLIFTGIKMLFSGDESIDPESNRSLKVIKKIFPVTHNAPEGKFFVVENGRRLATPLFITLIFIEFSDVVFAIDSVPAIFAISKEPLIVFTSNIFAILGLRSMFFLLSGVVDKFYLLKYALSIVLTFVGLKMVWLNKAFDGHFPIAWSLGIIGGVIGGSILLSLVFPKENTAQ